MVKEKSREKRWSVGMPFLVTYHSHVKNISKIIEKHMERLYTDPKVGSIF